MKSWIYALISLLPSYLSNPARWLADRIYGVYTDSVKFSKWIKGGVKSLRDKVKYFVDNARSFATEVLATFTWLMGVWVPKLIANAVRTARDYLLGKIAAARSYASGIVNELRNWAARKISEVNAFIGDTIAWATRKLNEIRDTLTRIRDIVTTLLASPERLATWLVGAMIDAIIDHALQRRERILKWVINNSLSFTVAVAREVERFIMRFL